MSNSQVRYGAEIRKRAAGVDKSRVARYACPKCSKESVKRNGNAKWECKSCGAIFAGGAYALSTLTGEASKKAVANYAKK